MGRIGTLLGILLLVLNVYAMLHVGRSQQGLIVKALWIAGIFGFPVIGFVAWALFGPRAIS
jgi:hypothetical protein